MATILNIFSPKIGQNGQKWSKWIRKPSTFTIVPKFDSFKDELIRPNGKIGTILNIFSPKIFKNGQNVSENHQISQWY